MEVRGSTGVELRLERVGRHVLRGSRRHPQSVCGPPRRATGQAPKRRRHQPCGFVGSLDGPCVRTRFRPDHGRSRRGAELAPLLHDLVDVDGPGEERRQVAHRRTQPVDLHAVVEVLEDLAHLGLGPDVGERAGEGRGLLAQQRAGWEARRTRRASPARCSGGPTTRSRSGCPGHRGACPSRQVVELAAFLGLADLPVDPGLRAAAHPALAAGSSTHDAASVESGRPDSWRRT